MGIGNFCLMVFQWRHARDFLEHAAEVLRVFKSEVVCGFRDAHARCKTVFGFPYDCSSDIVPGGVAGYFIDDISQIVSRHTQAVGTILNGGQSVFLLKIIPEVILQQMFKSGENVVVDYFASEELTVVKPLAIV